MNTITISNYRQSFVYEIKLVEAAILLFRITLPYLNKFYIAVRSRAYNFNRYFTIFG